MDKEQEREVGRPRIREDQKRRSVSISIHPDILGKAEATGNMSQFFEESVETCAAVLSLMRELGSGKGNRAAILEEIEDLVESWDSLGDEEVPLHVAFPPKKGKAKRRR